MDDHIVPHKFHVTREQRNQQKNHSSLLIWFTGLSGSGKSTLANALEKMLLEKGFHTYVLDGDNVRKGLNKNLGFAPEDRTENIRRIAEVSNLMLDAGLVVLSAFVSPYRKDRENVRNIVGPDHFIEIFVDTPLEICEKRDVKGLYQKARAGEIKNFTGIDAPYEIPIKPDLIIDTTKHSVEESIQIIFKSIAQRLLLRHE